MTGDPVICPVMVIAAAPSTGVNLRAHTVSQNRKIHPCNASL